jgi:hypothetical protein
MMEAYLHTGQASKVPALLDNIVQIVVGIPQPREKQLAPLMTIQVLKLVLACGPW